MKQEWLPLMLLYSMIYVFDLCFRKLSSWPLHRYSSPRRSSLHCRWAIYHHLYVEHSYLFLNQVRLSSELFPMSHAISEKKKRSGIVQKKCVSSLDDHPLDDHHHSLDIRRSINQQERRKEDQENSMEYEKFHPSLYIRILKSLVSWGVFDHKIWDLFVVEKLVEKGLLFSWRHHKER